MTADASVALMASLCSGTSHLSAGSASTYLARIRQFARLVMGEPDEDAFSTHAAWKLVAKRMVKWSPPKIDDRQPFPVSTVVRACADPTADPGTVAALAFAWDTLSRLGPLCSASSATGPYPIPLSHAGLSSPTALHLSVSITVFDKVDKAWSRVFTSADPGNSRHNPASVGAPLLVHDYVQRRREFLAFSGEDPATLPLWAKRSGRAVAPRDIALLLNRHRPPGLPPITGHAVRISCTSHLVSSKLSSASSIALLGRWSDTSSLRTYIRDHLPHLTTSSLPSLHPTSAP